MHQITPLCVLLVMHYAQYKSVLCCVCTAEILFSLQLGYMASKCLSLIGVLVRTNNRTACTNALTFCTRTNTHTLHTCSPRTKIVFLEMT